MKKGKAKVKLSDKFLNIKNFPVHASQLHVSTNRATVSSRWQEGIKPISLSKDSSIEAITESHNSKSFNRVSIQSDLNPLDRQSFKHPRKVVNLKEPETFRSCLNGFPKIKPN